MQTAFRHVTVGLKRVILFTKFFWQAHKNFRRATAVLLILIGFIALITPLTPGSWLMLVGLEIFGIRFLFWQKIKAWLKRTVVLIWSKKRFLSLWVYRVRMYTTFTISFLMKAWRFLVRVSVPTRNT